MRVAPISKFDCPRCRAPVKGDYKFCPECAFRLRATAPEPEETPAPASGHWSLLLGAFAVGLLVAGFLVGKQLWTEGGQPTPTPQDTANKPLRVIDIQDNLVRVGLGVANYQNVQVYDVPSLEEAHDRLLADFAADGGADFLTDVLDRPAGLGRWPALVRAFYERTSTLVEAKERAVPVETMPLKVMVHEVTCSQYAEGLRALAQEPRMLSRRDWVAALWRPQDEAAKTNARGYQAFWWQAVADHHRESLGRTVEPPDWLDLDPQATPHLTDAQGVLLLTPPHWVTLDDDGRITWDMPIGSSNLPVTNISWWDAHMFADWAGATLGMDLRLPTGAEWERIFHGNHPAKPGDDFDEVGAPGWRWPWGNEFDPHRCNNSNRSELEKKPKGLRDVRKRYGWDDGDTVDGVLNMAGNAAEWVDNWYADFPDEERRGGALRAYQREVHPPTEAYPHERAIENANTAGGSYLMGIDDCSVPFNRHEDKRARKIDVGFRLVLEEKLLGR